MAFSLNTIGSIYEHQKDYEKALDYYRKSLKIREAIGDKAGISWSLNGIGASYLMKKIMLKQSTIALSLYKCLKKSEMLKLCVTQKRIL
jgi:tetratricopeptide (TPR) repeat protein